MQALGSSGTAAAAVVVVAVVEHSAQRRGARVCRRDPGRRGGGEVLGVEVRGLAAPRDVTTRDTMAEGTCGPESAVPAKRPRLDFPDETSSQQYDGDFHCFAGTSELLSGG